MIGSELLAPGERLVQSYTKPKMVALDEFGTDVSGQHSMERHYRVLAEGARLLVTDARLLVLNHGGQPIHESVYDLSYLRVYLPNIKRWNSGVEAKIGQAQQGEGELGRWFTSGSYRKKFGLVDSVNMLTWAEHPRGLLGPKHYLLLTESMFRPMSAERQQALENEEAQASHVLEREKLKVEAKRVGPVFSYKPVQLSVHEHASLDVLASALSQKVGAMADYVGKPEGLEADYELPRSMTQGFAAYRPPDFEAPPT